MSRSQSQLKVLVHFDAATPVDVLEDVIPANKTGGETLLAVKRALLHLGRARSRQIIAWFVVHAGAGALK